ncbi:GNAT family N-acetyltransferase [Demequina aurantiaca]|uniref:GNAT family N-acetyltransferase n=1 Tax=Demequina aurantiaca TaxID=676200 RepID=UPI000A033AD1|nr:GNAT family protein [Demequina aurantiaca]
MSREVVLRRGSLTLRPLRRSDEAEWMAVRSKNYAWLRPWEANMPPGRPQVSASFPAYVRRERGRWKARTAFSMVIEWEGALVGRVSVHAIEWGAQCGGSIGYWIAEDHAGRGIVPRSVAMMSEYAFGEGLHRLEIALRPDNSASHRVVQKLGFRAEGLRAKYLYIDGAWRDHAVFALTAEEPREGPFWDPSF